MAFIRNQLELPGGLASGSRDDVLTALALTLTVLADGGLDNDEEALLDGYKQSLPDWQDLALSEEFADAVEAQLESSLAHYRDDHDLGDEDDFDPSEFALDAVDQLVEIESADARRRCFLLCVDLAMAAGGITETEDRLLEKMADVLSIEPALLEDIVAVTRLKYGCL